MKTVEHPTRIFWHRDLPPEGARPLGSHELEANSPPTTWRYGDRDALWAEHQPLLDAAVRQRLTQELDRLGADFAHVVEEHVEAHIEVNAGTFELRGRYGYVALAAP